MQVIFRNKRVLAVASLAMVLFVVACALFVHALMGGESEANVPSDNPTRTAGPAEDTAEVDTPAASPAQPGSQTPATPTGQQPAAAGSNKATSGGSSGAASGSGSTGSTSGGTSSGGGGASGGNTSSPEVAGLTNGSVLSAYAGPSTISSGTHVIENKRFTGRLTIAGGTVTIRNSSFNFGDYYHVLVNGGTVTVEHSEFDGMNTTTTADDLGITGDNITVRWSTFKRFVNGIRPGSNSLIEHNVISNPNTAYGPAHTDGIEVYGGTNIVIRSNTINIAGGIGETGCVNIATDFSSISNVTVENNDFTGGTYSLYARLQGAGSSITGIKVRNNRWHTPHMYGTHSVSPTSAISEWAGNTLNGVPLSFEG